tara:strand:+ start:515 stop:1030 length:516 start_codon:yes stop_codon:yes gene_type:complete
MDILIKLFEGIPKHTESTGIHLVRGKYFDSSVYGIEIVEANTLPSELTTILNTEYLRIKSNLMNQIAQQAIDYHINPKISAEVENLQSFYGEEFDEKKHKEQAEKPHLLTMNFFNPYRCNQMFLTYCLPSFGSIAGFVVKDKIIELDTYIVKSVPEKYFDKIIGIKRIVIN